MCLVVARYPLLHVHEVTETLDNTIINLEPYFKFDITAVCHKVNCIVISYHIISYHINYFELCRFSTVLLFVDESKDCTGTSL